MTELRGGRTAGMVMLLLTSGYPIAKGRKLNVISFYESSFHLTAVLNGSCWLYWTEETTGFYWII
jgi:hypothetical protein